MQKNVQPANGVAHAIRSGVVSEGGREGDNGAFRFTEEAAFSSPGLVAHIGPGNEVSFPLAIDSGGARAELYIRKASSSRRSHDLYQAPISHAAKPKADKCGQLYVRAEVSSGRVAISSVHLPCEILRDYFYVANRHRTWERQTSLYDNLRTALTVSLAELRPAFKSIGTASRRRV